MALTAKQAQFVAEYMIDLNATQAAIRAGYSAKTAGKIGPELLGKTSISEAISKAQKAREARTGITADRVIAELAKIGFADIRKAVRWGDGIVVRNEFGTPEVVNDVALIGSEQIDDDTAAAIAEICQTAQGVKIKLHDKRAALIDIGRHIGMFRDKLELTGKDGGPIKTQSETKLDLDKLSDAALAEIEAACREAGSG